MSEIKIKHKVTIRQKQPVEQPKVEQPRPKRRLTWLWGVLGVVAVAAVVAVVCLRNDDSRDEAQPVQEPVVEEIVPQKEAAPEAPAVESAPVVEPEQEPEQEPTAEPEQKRQEPEQAPVAARRQESQPTTPQGDTEAMARRTIRGDFGNGDARKQQLGSRYQTIQNRVNEIYRENNH